MLLLQSAITVYLYSKWQAMLAYTKYYKKVNTDKNICCMSNEITQSWSHNFWVIMKYEKKTFVSPSKKSTRKD